jgi:hypothetical protein
VADVVAMQLEMVVKQRGEMMRILASQLRLWNPLSEMDFYDRFQMKTSQTSNMPSLNV